MTADVLHKARKTGPMGVAVIGVGFMGRTHIRAYQRAASEGWPCELRAVCDVVPGILKGGAGKSGNIAAGAAGDQPLFDPSGVRVSSHPDEIFSNSSVDLVSICTYTDSHVELAMQALRAGKHVLVEKPVANNSRDVQQLEDVARETGRHCMPAMCMRFWPGWNWLHDRVRDHAFGAVRSATFQRLGAQPSWAQSFYGDITRSGGALLDLHIHDVDFIHWCFGPPRNQEVEAVTTTGSLQHLTTQYRFANGPTHVTAEAAWDLSPAAGFRMRYLVNFERATADFDLSRPHPLMLHDANGSHAVDLPSLTGYDGEIRHMLDVIAGKSNQLIATLDEAFEVMKTLEAEQQSMESRQSVNLRQ